MKKCFTCKIKYPLFMFGINHMKYQIKSDKGKLVDCRICTCKRFIKQKGNVCKYNFTIKKFEVITLKVNLKNIIKQFLNK
tara:strand:- start:96 stop:335 length:240 start_codon:yes stop_codon:yes gene_type:complete